MRNIPRSLVAGGVLAASLFLAASPAHAWGGRFRVFARPHVGAHFFARPFVPRVGFFPRARFYYSYPYYSYPVVGAYAYPYPYAYGYSYYPCRYYASPRVCYPRAAVVYRY